MSKLSDQVNAYKAVTASRKGVPFHKAVMDEYKANPDASDAKYKAAKREGVDNANAFIDSCRDMNHPQHDQNLNKYNNTFHRDPQKVEDHFVSDAMTRNGTGQVEYSNTSYED